MPEKLQNTLADAKNKNPRRAERRPLSIAPMMEVTDRHFRYFMRQLTKKTLLYTEMVTTGAVLHGDKQKLLDFDPAELPLALQLGGDNPAELAECTRIAGDWGYSEVNLNVGCPSDRVQKGKFGACLMATPEQVASCVEAMRKATALPVTVKHRIGINNLNRYEDLARFVEVVAAAGCDRFIVHARIALLQGLDPKGNRTVPPLRYEDVYRLKADFPNLLIEVNGGIRQLSDIRTHLRKVDGVMIGRAAQDNPFMFGAADQIIFGESTPPPTRRDVIQTMAAYIDRRMAEADDHPNRITRHLLGLFAYRPGARAWKRYLSENAHKPGTTGDVLRKAARAIAQDVLNESPEEI